MRHVCNITRVCINPGPKQDTSRFPQLQWPTLLASIGWNGNCLIESLSLHFPFVLYIFILWTKSIAPPLLLKVGSVWDKTVVHLRSNLRVLKILRIWVLDPWWISFLSLPQSPGNQLEAYASGMEITFPANLSLQISATPSLWVDLAFTLSNQCLTRLPL